jgi:glutamate receptor, ionotropic, invertebrate
MWAVMENEKPSVFVSANSKGVERVQKGKGSYAFFMESTLIEYELHTKCDLTQIGGLLDSKSYGIAMPVSRCL